MSTTRVIGGAMPLLRSQITHIPSSSDPPKDYAVNVVYHWNTTLGGLLPVDYQNHADEIATLFHGDNTTTGSSFKYYSNTQVIVKVYDMGDTEPRPIRATSTRGTSTVSAANHQPRVLAICLSFYATQNIPRQRGRLYVGPFNVTNSPSIGPTVGSTDRANIVDLGHGLFDIGGANVEHVVYSPTSGQHHTVTDYWCNDVWDVMHSREAKESTRTKLHP